MFLRRVLAVTLLAVTAGIVPSVPAHAYPSDNVNFVGHGWGHGRGMGQYGGLGYALNHNWSYEQILNHFYGGTSLAGGWPNDTIHVRMLEQNGREAAEPLFRSRAGYNVAGIAFAPNEAVRFRRIGASNFAIDKSPASATSCGGPWTQVGTAGGQPTAMPNNLNPGDDRNQMLSLCFLEGERFVRGTLRVHDEAGSVKTINALPFEDYVRGVVPRESPASWGDLGGGKGMQALKAQAVAARSYAATDMVPSKYGYAHTCNTQTCQVYGGAWVEFNGQVSDLEPNQTNQAVNETLGQVRRHTSNNNVARTEFSSSTGGYTAGGTFPAVVDAGDSISSNPNHTWTASIPVATVESKYPSVGSLQQIRINSRNGLGDMGGRVNSVSVVGSAGTVTVTGDSLRSTLGLKSNWFRVTEVGCTTSGGADGYRMLDADGAIFAFCGAPYYGAVAGMPMTRPVVGMDVHPADNGYWIVASDGGVFSFGSSAFHGSTGAMSLNQPIVGMAAHPSGGGYWLVASDGGTFNFGNAGFHGSTGNLRLNQPIVGMASTPSGNGYWLVAADGGIFNFGDAPFLGSLGHLQLNQPITGMAGRHTNGGYWLVAGDGGVFVFGDAPYLGSLPGSGEPGGAGGFAPTPTGNGYNIATRAGFVYAYGDAPYVGGVHTQVPGYGGRILAMRTSKI